MKFDQLKYKLGGQIKKLRKSKGYTQEQLAEKIGIDNRHLSGIETGSNTPSLKLLLGLSNQLGIEIKDLFEFSDTSKNIRHKIHDLIDLIDDRKLNVINGIMKII